MSDDLQVVELAGELPIGAGKAAPPRRAEPLEGEREPDADDRPLGHPAEAAPVALEQPALVEPVQVLTPEKLTKPLQVLVGKPINGLVRRRYQLETDAGLMSNEHAEAIAEPGAEILNRRAPNLARVVAEKGAELNLVIAIYDYVHETNVKIGHDLLLRQDAAAAAAQVREASGVPPMAVPATDVPTAPPEPAVPNQEVPEL